MEVGSFGSAVLWLLVTFPAYWVYQWTVEGEPFTLFQRQKATPQADHSRTASDHFTHAS